jgi:hypothetical protein
MALKVPHVGNVQYLQIAPSDEDTALPAPEKKPDLVKKFGEASGRAAPSAAGAALD